MAKLTAREQGVPEVYLNENGKFKPGMSSVYRYDLVASALGIKSNGAKAPFPRREALRKLKQRNWLKFCYQARAKLQHNDPSLTYIYQLEQAVWDACSVGITRKKILKAVKRAFDEFSDEIMAGNE